MDKDATNSHIAPEQTADYFGGKLSNEEAWRIEQHLLHCDECTRTARRMYALQELLENWAPHTYAQAYLSEKKKAALQVIEPTHKPWRERLQRWGREQSAAALRVAIGTHGKVVELITEVSEALVTPGGGFTLDLQPLLTRGGGGGQPKMLSAQTRINQRKLSVEVRGGQRTVEVRLERWPLQRTPPLVLLFPIGEQAEVQIQELQRSAEQEDLLARFENIAPGDYVLAVEPQEP